MRICIIPPIISGTVSGGINTQITKTIEAFEAKGNKVILFNQWEKYNWQEFDIVHIFRADSANLAMAQWLNSNKVPFVVSPIFYSTHNPFKIKLSIKITEIGQTFLSGLTSDLMIKKEICNLSSLILPNTNAEKELIQHSMDIPDSKFTVIPNGIDTSFTNAKPDLFHNKYGVSNFILSTGHFGFKRKNLLRLLKSVENIQCPLVLIGSLFNDEYSNKCKELINSSDKIIWIDSLSHNDPLLASAYAAASVFALPSFYETPGLSALEAAVCGCKIVISPLGGTKEYFKGYAKYPNPLQTKSIEKAISDSLKEENHPSLQKLIIDNFNWNNVADLTLNAYDKAIRKNAS